jgi:DNA-directed RNA polymerase subunit RPC12/RpoP
MKRASHGASTEVTCPVCSFRVTVWLRNLDTLPKVPIPVQCPACGDRRPWTPSAAWIKGDEPSPTR